MDGISICTLTYNVFFYNRLYLDQVRKLTRLVEYEILFSDNGSTDGSREWLREQSDVRLFEGTNNQMRHGQALDFLVREARFPIVCALDSDAFPVSPEWIVPALYLDDQVTLAGVDRERGRLRHHYVCPSYLFGWRDWLREHSFLDNWPRWDTGEKMSQDCVDEGRKLKLWKRELVDFGDRFESKPCDYSGLVWHTWWGARSQIFPALAGQEFEHGYHEFVMDLLRKRYGLDY